MIELNVELEKNSYPVIINDNFEQILNLIKDKWVKCVVITDSNIAPLYLESLCNVLKEGFEEVFTYTVEAGEISKSMETAKEIYQFLMKQNIYRKDILIGLGGGVVGDLTGFVAATYLRGVSLIHLPTSLLAQVDSSLGGKTAINYLGMKNVIGSFYQPSLVYSNIEVLKTLPENELRSAIVEMIVHAVIKSEKLFQFIEKNLDKIICLDSDILMPLIEENCIIKKGVVEADEKELGERAILNFGHSYGHAIEGAMEYKYKHGECVALGIIGACLVGERLHVTERNTTIRIQNLLKRLRILRDISKCDTETVMHNLLHDKKNTDGKIYFILPVRIGEVIKREIEDVNMVQEVFEALSENTRMDSRFK